MQIAPFEASDALLDFVSHIPRAAIDGIHDMRVDGAVRELGVVKNFRNHEYLREHLPQNVSISWTHLGPGQTLEPHVHPVPSMIIVTRGQGRSIGDSQLEFQTGDVIVIPAYNSHGFVGVGEGFWALSVQFKPTAIFETEVDPLTQYPEGSVPADPRSRPLEIISRDGLDSIHSVDVDGQTHNLGLVKNFGCSAALRELLPENLSLAWVQLRTGETLNVHQHRESSMIIVTQGDGVFFGEGFHPLHEGDIMFVPEGHLHGFSGSGEGGFWGLSIQFNETSLYERADEPRVAFGAPEGTFAHLLQRNDELAAKFLEHSVFECIERDLLRDPDVRARFLAGLSIWSAYFQRIIMARSAFSNPGPFADLFYEHLVEELGHDKSLEQTCVGTQVGFDPALEGMCAWFVYQTLASDNADRVVMTNLVLERAGREFYVRYSRYLRGFGIDQHFEEHVEHDEKHETMGLDQIDELTPAQYARLEKTQQDSWQMLGGVLERVVAIAIGGASLGLPPVDTAGETAANQAVV